MISADTLLKREFPELENKIKEAFESSTNLLVEKIKISVETQIPVNTDTGDIRKGHWIYTIRITVPEGE